MQIDMKDFVEYNFSVYAAMTIENRAICSVTDMLKPSQRLCMYSQLINKLTYDKPYKKSNKSVAACLDFGYIHGTTSCYDLLVRMAKPFCLNYLLEDFEGQYTIRSGNAQSADRYTSIRLGELGTELFDGIKENAIETWLDNYDNTDKYPTELPSLGYYNICNGAMGLACSISCSIPQFNLREVNEAMIKLLWNPDISFDEIYCEPDFCTGGTILNSSKVKEMLRVGYGGAIIQRCDIDYNEEENCLYITHLPYAVYSERILEQLKELSDNKELVGVKRINDLSAKTTKIKIELEKNVNVDKLLRFLYKKTDLQNAFTINMTMLENNTRPKVFGWKEALQAHINHEIKCYKRIYQFRLDKIDERINIIDGILIILNNIDKTIEIIKNSSDKVTAKNNLIEYFNLNEPQANAILKLTLSKITHLETQEYVNEKENLLKEKETYELYLSDKNELYKQIEKRMKAVADKYGDDRKTKCIDLDFTSEEDDAEPIEKKELLIYQTNLNNLYTVESSTLLTGRRGNRGSKVKLSKNEVITKAIRENNLGSLLVFTNNGKMYRKPTSDLPINSKINLNLFFELEPNEIITSICTYKKENPYFLFITKNGLIKKTKASEYNSNRGKSIKAISLNEGDEVVNVLFTEKDKVGLLTYNGNFVIIETENINSIGRTSHGIKAIQLGENDYIIDCKPIEANDSQIITVSEKGLIKKTSLNEFSVSGRGCKGKKVAGTSANDHIIKYLTTNKKCDIIIISKRKNLKISSDEIKELTRVARGIKSISIDENDCIIDLLKEVN